MVDQFWFVPRSVFRLNSSQSSNGVNGLGGSMKP